MSTIKESKTNKKKLFLKSKQKFQKSRRLQKNETSSMSAYYRFYGKYEP